jgi:hypothetical protein
VGATVPRTPRLSEVLSNFEWRSSRHVRSGWERSGCQEVGEDSRKLP